MARGGLPCVARMQQVRRCRLVGLALVRGLPMPMPPSSSGPSTWSGDHCHQTVTAPSTWSAGAGPRHRRNPPRSAGHRPNFRLISRTTTDTLRQRLTATPFSVADSPRSPTVFSERRRILKLYCSPLFTPVGACRFWKRHPSAYETFVHPPPPSSNSAARLGQQVQVLSQLDRLFQALAGLPCGLQIGICPAVQLGVVWLVGAQSS